MPPPKAYVPSFALIRALARPQPSPCPFARPLPMQFVRGKKSKAARARETERTQLAQQAKRDQHNHQAKLVRRAEAPKLSKHSNRAGAEQSAEEQEQKARMAKAMSMAIATLPPEARYFLAEQQKEGNSQEAIFGDLLSLDAKSQHPDVDLFEMDLQKGTRTKVDPKEVEMEKKLMALLNESYTNPDFDDAVLYQHMLDMLIASPDCAEDVEIYKDIKNTVMTREEIKAAHEEGERQGRAYLAELEELAVQGYHKAMNLLLNHPELGDARTDVQASMDKWNEVQKFTDDEFQTLLSKALEVARRNPVLQAALDDAFPGDPRQEMEELVRKAKEDNAEERIQFLDEDGNPKIPEPEDVEKKMREIFDEFKKFDSSKEYHDEVDAIFAEHYSLAENETELDESAIIRLEAVAKELTRVLSATTGTPVTEFETGDAPELPPDIQASVDQLVHDPDMMEKLLHMVKLLAKTQHPELNVDDVTQIDHSAPDPFELDASETTTLEQQMKTARADPEHRAALSRLRVRLQPPYNVSPVLKAFNQALQLAYVGGNDDVRRVLWRTYQKARSLPTLLQNISDDAWDILYYSQAVTWKGNQNRNAHLKILLEDLKTVGRDGPPTHPSTVGQQAVSEQD